jgi:hypothetical protein
MGAITTSTSSMLVALAVLAYVVLILASTLLLVGRVIWAEIKASRAKKKAAKSL